MALCSADVIYTPPSVSSVCIEYISSETSTRSNSLISDDYYWVACHNY